MKNHPADLHFLSSDSVSPEQALGLLLNHLDDLFLLIDRNLQIVATTGLTLQKIKVFYGLDVRPGHSILDLMPPERHAFLRSLYAEVFEGSERKSDLEFELGPTSFVFELVIRPARDTDGEIVAAVVIVKDVTSSRKAVDDLRQIEERWRFALEGAKQGVWDWNMQTGDIFYSKSYKHLYGYEEDELKGRIEEWETMIHPDDRQKVNETIQKHIEGPDPYSESIYRIRDKKGDYRWILAKGMIISHNAQGPLRMIGTHTDITEQVNIEKQYRSLFKSNPLPCWIYDTESLKFLEVNQAAVEHYGYSEEEFLNADIYLVHPPASHGQLRERLLRENLSVEHKEFNWVHQKKNGHIIYVDLSINTILYKGRSARLVVAHNVTDKVLTEQALRISNERFELAAKASSEALWEWNVGSGNLYISQAYSEIFGWPVQAGRKFEEWLNFIHPDDRRETVNEFYAAVKNPETSHWSKEYRYLNANGGYAHVIDKAIIIRDAQGKAVKVVGAIQDRTAQKAVEEELRKSNERFRLVSKATSDAIYDLDLVKNDLYWGEGLLTLFGFHPNQVPLSKWEELVHPDDRIRVVKSLNDTFKSYKTYWQEEYRFAKATGGYGYVLDRGYIIRDHKNNPVRMIGSMQDISERKYSEQLLSLERTIFELSTNPKLEFRDIVTTLLKGIEDIHEDAHTSVILLKDDNTIEHFAAPRLPDAFTSGLNGLTIGPNEGSCGAAMSRKETVIVEDIQNDPLWVKYRDYIKDFGLKACWSLPIIHSSGKVMGSFAIYYKTVKGPTKTEIETLERVRNILRVLMENNWSIQQIKEAHERFDIMMKATHDLIWDWNLEKHLVYRNELGLEKVYGVADNNHIVSIYDWLKRVHPEDRDRIGKVIDDIVRTKSQNLFEVEYRFLRDDGTYSHVYDRGMIIRNAEGKPVRMIGAAQDVTERKRLEKELLQNELEKQKAINQATVDTQEQERSEIGKELHDNVNQVLTTTKLYLDLALSNPELKDELIEKSNKNIIMVINEIRQLSRSLMDPSIGDLGLIDSINDLIGNINLTRKLHVELEAEEDLEWYLDKHHKLAVFRIIQEALNNAIRHARATRVKIHFSCDDQFARLVITDDGIGFEPSMVKKGAGLKNIQNRIYLINGTHRIDSAPGRGCRIELSFPVFTKKIEQSN